ncbi:MAG: YIP1 family protein [Sulfuriferula sp.]|nr:YIP1 family protein [Sulfuriferula sp.]
MQLAHSPHQPHLFSFTHMGHWMHGHHFPTVTMFLFYVLPLSVIAPLMFYYAGTHHNIVILSDLDPNQLSMIGMVFFTAELIMTFVLAGFIEWLGNATSKIVHTQYEMLNYPTPKITSAGVEHTHHKVDFRDAYTLAAIAPTPLWLVSLALFVPSFTFVATLGVIALALSLYILYSAAPSILKIEGQGEGALMGWVLLSAGMVGWALMMYLTLITWAYTTSGAYM